MSRIRRVILAQDVASRDTQTIATAVELAARLGVRVLGVFLEDPSLLRWASLPVARQVSPWGSGVDRERLAAQLRALSIQAQAELEVTAQRLGVPWSAQVLRGALQELVEETADDLWIIGTASRVMGLEVQLFSMLRPALPRVARLILLLPRNTAFQRPLVVLHGHTASAEAVLEAALGLMEMPAQPLSVLMIGNRTRLAASVQAWQAQRNVVVRPIHLSQAGIEELAGVAALVGCDVLVVGADWPPLEGEGFEARRVRTPGELSDRASQDMVASPSLERLLAAIRLPVLVVQ
ncbi:hypothetical protein [uncultured Meiothermus sp.]|jgi:nucleotide-binding universal stress UspA family protein|uniref:hypothetical protein n=1 Tax=uncultured Meiothermus sp. TaxID=157471 RepID=UPI00260E1970|nr:hypothetical protein [uncultured Meiothermus sp.]